MQLVAWTSTLLGFYMFLRKMNLFLDTLQGFNPEIQLGRRNVFKSGKGYIARVYHTKTIQNKEQVLDIPILPNPDLRICPVFWLELMLAAVPAGPMEPLFAVPAEKDELLPLMYGQWTWWFRHWLGKAGHNETVFSGHSLRWGGASWAAACKISMTAICLLGDWNSLAFLNYIDMSLQDRYDVMCVFNMSM